MSFNNNYSIPASVIQTAIHILSPLVPSADISHHKMNKLNENSAMKWINRFESHPLDNDTNITGKSLFNQINSNLSDTEDNLAHLSHEHISNLEPHHFEAITNYISGGLDAGHETGSRQINNHLIQAYKSKRKPQTKFTFDIPYENEEKVQVDLTHIDDALNKNTLKHPLVTYSGIGFNPKELINHENKLHLPAYTSSSTSRQVALMYATPDKNKEFHMLQIKHPVGSKGLYVGDDAMLSPFSQKEHISPRGTTLSINPSPKKFKDVNGNVLNVWRAERIT